MAGSFWIRTIGQMHPFAATGPVEPELLLGTAVGAGAAVVGGAEAGGAAAGCSTGVGGGNVAVLLEGSLPLLCCCGCENGS